MKREARWVLALVLLVLVGFATHAFAESLRNAPRARLARLSRAAAATVRPAKSEPPASAPRAEAPKVETPREAKATPACAATLHFVPLRGCIRDALDEGRDLAAVVYPDRAVKLRPLPPPAEKEEEVDLATADRKMEALYAEQDYDGALKVALSACKQGDAFACALAGNMETRGEGRRAKTTVAERGAGLVAKGCKMGDTWGCTRQMNLEGR